LAAGTAQMPLQISCLQPVFLIWKLRQFSSKDEGCFTSESTSARQSV